MKFEEEEEMEGYTLGEFHALLSLLVDVEPHKEFVERYFGNDMTPKQRMDYIKVLMR